MPLLAPRANSMSPSGIPRWPVSSADPGGVRPPPADTAFASSLTALLVLGFLFGVAMGGERGIGASLAMESIPAKARGAVSGLLQSGYPCGFFLAALANWLLFDLARTVRGRRDPRMAGAVLWWLGPEARGMGFGHGES